MPNPQPNLPGPKAQLNRSSRNFGPHVSAEHYSQMANHLVHRRTNLVYLKSFFFVSYTQITLYINNSLILPYSTLIACYYNEAVE